MINSNIRMGHCIEEGIRFSRKIDWEIVSMKSKWKGINRYKRETPLIVTLTSFPARIDSVDQTIKSILTQSIKPDEVILWLAREEFLGKEQELPGELIKLKKYGLSIKWCDDLKSYKKLIPALQENMNAIYVTADDDIIYRYRWLEILYNAYLYDNQYIYCHRATKFFFVNNNLQNVGGGYDVWDKPTYLHKVTGAGGVLYPPNCFYKDILDIDLFTRICTTNDDIWFWFMAALNGYRVCVPSNAMPGLLYVGNTQNGPSLTHINDSGQNLFTKDLEQMLNHYPKVLSLLREEFKELSMA